MLLTWFRLKKKKKKKMKTKIKNERSKNWKYILIKLFLQLAPTDCAKFSNILFSTALPASTTHTL